MEQGQCEYLLKCIHFHPKLVNVYKATPCMIIFRYKKKASHI